jgi:hypothetical protein
MQQRHGSAFAGRRLRAVAMAAAFMGFLAGGASPAPARAAAPPEVTILDTSLVGSFHEPRHQGNDPNLAKICAPGALRVVLAFATGGAGFTPAASGTGPAYVWPTDTYEDTINGTTATVDPAGSDAYGQGYMLYLAFGVEAPGVSHQGLLGVLRGGGLSGRPADATTIANYEYSCEGNATCGHKSAAPFALHWLYRGSGGSSAQMDKDVRRSIGLGVPVFVATLTASTEDPNLGLPSWAVGLGNHMIAVKQKDGTVKQVRSRFHGLEPGGHAIAIVGFDSSNYYYVDTCAAGVWPGLPTFGCRAGPQDSGYTDSREAIFAHVDSATGREHVWSVRKATLYRLLDEWILGGAYLSYGGAPGHAPY